MTTQLIYPPDFIDPIPPEVWVSSGDISGWGSVSKFGRNTDIDQNVAEDIWDGGGLYSYLTTAESYTFTSTSGSDGAGESGASRITVQGLDESWNEAEEDVDLVSGGSALTSGSFIRIFRVRVRSAGSDAQNLGDIQAYSNSSSTISAQVSTGNNQTLMAVYSIPASTNGYLTDYYASSLRSQTSGAVDVAVYIRPFGEVFQVKHVNALQTAGTSYLKHKFEIPLKITEKSDIRLQATSTANNFDVSGGFNLYLKS
jgi:hypothetical protein